MSSQYFILAITRWKLPTGADYLLIIMMPSAVPTIITASIESTHENGCDGVEWTLSFLKLVIAQIEMSVTEDDSSSKALSRSNEAMASKTQEILSQWMRDSSRCDHSPAATQVSEPGRQFYENPSANSVAFQSKDRLIQQLKHIQDSLNGLTTLLVKPSLVNSQNEIFQTDESSTQGPHRHSA